MNILKNIIVFTFIAMIPVYGQSLKDVDKQYLRDNERLSNGGFEQGARGWTNVAGTLAVSKLNTYKGKNHLRITLSNQTLDLSQSFNISKETGGSLASCRISTTIAGIQLSTISNGVVSLTKNIIADGKYNIATIKDVYPATSAAVKIYSSAPVTGVVDIDDCSFHDVPPGYTQEVVGSHIVGKLNLSNDCIYDRTLDPYDYYTDATCSATSIIGSVSLPTDSSRAGVKILNPRSDGYYKFEYNGLLYKAAAGGYCLFSWSKTNVKTDGNGEGGIFGPEANNSLSSLTGTARFESGESAEMFIAGRSSLGVLCRVYGTSSDPGAITVYFYPDETSHVVTQEIIKTVKTENTFSAKILTTNPTNVFDLSMPDWLACTRSAVGVTNCLFHPDMNLQNGMNCVPKVWGGGFSNGYNTSVSGQTTTGFTLSTSAGGVASDSIGTEIICHKHTNDSNKNGIVQGKFEAINDTPIVKVKGRGTTGGTLVDSVTPINWIETQDTHNAWDGNTFTSPRVSSYKFTGNYYFTPSGSLVLTRIYIDTGSGFNDFHICGAYYANDIKHFSCEIELGAGHKAQLRTYNGGGTLQTSVTWNVLSITEQPSIASLIKNLNKNNNFKYQRKNQLSYESAAGTLADLTFNNLVIGKKYKVRGNIDSANGTIMWAEHGTKTIFRHINFSGAEMSTGMNGITFTATTTTLTFRKEAAGTVYGTVGNTGNETWMELVQFPDNYVETTEFN